ncbi:MAG: hypothetical protein HY040_05345 [Planctomycetes bacterium]|nr:hypothetical protein [Planctomycetota bacterium]
MQLRAQAPGLPAESGQQKPLLNFDAALQRETSSPSGAAARVRLFGMPTGFLRDPVGLDSDDPALPADPMAARANPDDDFSGILVSMGNYNPYFDMRRPEDPRGLGYYKVHSQMQVLDLGRTNVSLTLQALTPAGLESGGVANGPTIVSPSFACFQDLGYGAALQGYIGQDIMATSRWTDNLGTRVHYGVGVQCPVPGLCPQSDQGLFFFVQALGRYRYDTRTDGKTAVWEVIPGLHWRVNDNCWLSIGASKLSLLTWSWQF